MIEGNQRMSTPLADKVAIVTGGSRGIGAAIVRRLARDGARVAFSYARSEARAKALEAEVAASAGEAVGIQADQADERQAADFVTAAHARLGRLDIVVNSAGIAVGGKVDDPAADIAALKRMMAINLNGVVATVRAAAPLLAQGGRIVSIGSVAASHISFPGFADYAAAKAAVAAYTRGWARDLGPRGITVNAIQPGAINTESNPKESDFARALIGMTPLGRYGEPDEIAAAVAFLTGPDAAFITGAILNVDGGQGT